MYPGTVPQARPETIKTNDHAKTQAVNADHPIVPLNSIACLLGLLEHHLPNHELIDSQSNRLWDRERPLWKSTRTQGLSAITSQKARALDKAAGQANRELGHRLPFQIKEPTILHKTFYLRPDFLGDRRLTFLIGDVEVSLRAGGPIVTAGPF